MRKLKTAVLSSILVLLLCASQPLHAGLFLSVDFDINEPGIQNQARADNQGNVTAWIVLFLTGNTDMYAYEFSVRYNSDRLTLISKDDNPPPNVNGKPFVESLSGENSKSGSGGGFDHYIEINRFDGKIDNNFDVITSADIPENGLVLGVLNFTVIGSGDDLLLLPGEFELPQAGQDVSPFDYFLGSDGRIETSGSFQGGSIVAVPEPTSILLLVCAGVIWVVKRRFAQTGTRLLSKT